MTRGGRRRPRGGSRLTARPIPAVSCDTSVSITDLQSALNAANDNDVICITGSGTTSDTITVPSGLDGVTILGNGYTLTGDDYFPLWINQGATNISLSNLILTGAFTDPGVYYAGTEDGHGIHINGGSGLVYDNLTISNVQGDGFYVAQNGTTPANGVTISNSSITGNGRMGIAVVAGQNVTATDMTFHNIAFSVIDLEPDWNVSYQQIANNCTFSGGTVTGWVGNFDGSGLVDAPAFAIGTPYTDPGGGAMAPDIDTCLIEDYWCQDNITGIRGAILPSSGDYRVSSVTVQNNTGDSSTVAGIGSGLGYWIVNHCDGFTMTGNAQDVSSGVYAATIADCTSVTVSGNTGTNLAGQIAP